MAQEVATVNVRDMALPEDAIDITAQDAGKGVSFKAEDQLLPLIYVLQTNSPAVNKRGEAYVKDAEPGDFWFRGALDPVKKGEEGFTAIPCMMVRTWIEWRPKRQGFVARHDAEPADTEDKIIHDDDGKEETIRVRKSTGNHIQDTREFYLMVNGQPFVLPCAGTKHTFAKQWNTMFTQFHNPKTNDVMPAYSRKYKLSTWPQSNAVGDWFGIKFEDLGWVDFKTEYPACRKFYDQVIKGEKRAEAPIAEGQRGEDGDIPF